MDIGRGENETVIKTYNVSAAPNQGVTHDRLERVPYPVIQDAIAARWRAYGGQLWIESNGAVTYTHHRAHETKAILGCRPLLEKKQQSYSLYFLLNYLL